MFPERFLKWRKGEATIKLLIRVQTDQESKFQMSRNFSLCNSPGRCFLADHGQSYLSSNAIIFPILVLMEAWGTLFIWISNVQSDLDFENFIFQASIWPIWNFFHLSVLNLKWEMFRETVDLIGSNKKWDEIQFNCRYILTSQFFNQYIWQRFNRNQLLLIKYSQWRLTHAFVVN